MGREPLSRIEKILSNIVGEGSYELDPPLSDAEEILIAILNDETIDIVARDRFCTILLCILNGEEYTGVTMSRAEEILKCISEGEKYEVDEWTYENVLSRVEQLLTDWANAEDPEYSKTVSGILIHVLDAVEKPAESLVVTMEPKQEATPFIDATTKEPYLSKTASTTGNKRYLDKIVGGTVCWNQLIELSTSAFNISAQAELSVDSSDNSFCLLSKTNNNVYSKGCLTFLTENHVYIAIYKIKATNPNYYIRVGFKTTGGDYRPAEYIKTIEYNNTTYSDTQYMIQKTNSTYIRFSFGLKTNTPQGDGGYVKDLMFIDLTLMFANAPAIADYIYSLEQATAGAGVEWLKSHGFIDDNYRTYNAGELISAKPTAFTVGSNTYALGGVDLRGLFKLNSNNNLYCDGDIYPPSGQISERYGIVDLGTLNWTFQASSIWNCFSASVGKKKGASNIICSKYRNGAVYGTSEDLVISGNASASYTIYIRDNQYNGDATSFKAAMDGVYLVYEKETPTTSSQAPYTNPAPISNGDTESFTDTRAVPIPVGNESHYAGEYEIEGHESVTVYQAQTQDEPNPTEYEVEFTEQGTVFGGTVDLVNVLIK